MRDRAWNAGVRALDYGCGSGWWTNELASMGFDPFGADISESGIEMARRAFPSIGFTTDTSREGLCARGPFELVTAIEVLPHCFMPREDVSNLYECMAPGGRFVVCAPYHGYLKNLAMALTGSLERHLDTSWSGAYVHFFSVRTLSVLLRDAGFVDIEVTRAGRIAPLAKSMIVACRKPSLGLSSVDVSLSSHGRLELVCS